MNIKQATDQIQGAIRAYLSKNEHGLYRIPFHMQRPIIMFGPPGVGKTAIVSQIAQDMCEFRVLFHHASHASKRLGFALHFPGIFRRPNLQRFGIYHV